MLHFLQIASFISVLFSTFLIFQSIGLQRDSLFYSRAEKLDFDRILSGYFGSYALVANVLGTLTSLATVYVFFIGTSKVFGFYIFICPIAIGASYIITNRLTNTILSNRPAIRDLYAQSDQISAVVSSLVWSDTRTGQHSAQLVKYISLLNIAAVIWLEFSIFADIFGQMIGLEGLAERSAIVLLTSFSVIYFTIRFGLRGFVFADVLQSPLIVIGSAALLIGAAIAVYNANTSSPDFSLANALSPAVPAWDGLVFILHVLVLNSFLVVVSEGHWLRTWVFRDGTRDRESDMQRPAAFTTAGLWTLLIVIGLLSSNFTHKVGNDGVIDVLQYINNSTGTLIFLCAFWVAATAALFSTADAQIYSFLVVDAFDPKVGRFKPNVLRPTRAIATGAIVSLTLTGIYFAVRAAGISFEKFIFIIIPLNLNFLPAIACISRGYEPSHFLIWLSVVLYATCAILGLQQPNNEFFWTLMSALMPVGISGLLFIPYFGRFILDKCCVPAPGFRTADGRDQ